MVIVVVGVGEYVVNEMAVVVGGVVVMLLFVVAVCSGCSAGCGGVLFLFLLRYVKRGLC